MLDGHIRSTIERVLKHDCVLLIQDTTNLDFAHHPSTKGLGHLDNLAQYGMKLHTNTCGKHRGRAVRVGRPSDVGARA
jgi:hypothetical protein